MFAKPYYHNSNGVQILDLPYYSESSEFCPEILFNSGKYSRASTALHVASLITKLCMLSDKADTGKHARIWHEILSLYIRQISVHPHNSCASFPRSFPRVLITFCNRQ